MKLILLILICTIFCNNTNSQTKEYKLLLCISYHPPFYNQYIRDYRYFLPSKRFNKIEPKNVDNIIYDALFNSYSSADPVLCGSYFLFYDSDVNLYDLYKLGLIHFPFVQDLNYFNPLSNRDFRSINSHCIDFKYYPYKNIFYAPNILGLQFCMNMFDTEFYDVYPLYPISIACIPVKLYGQLEICSFSSMIIPNWNRNSPSEPMTYCLDSVPIYKINSFDSIKFYTNNVTVSKKNKKYLIVNSNNSFKEHIRFYRILNRKYFKRGKYNKRNLPVFKSDRKLSFYFNVR
jgi:hypothetical protein